MIRAIVAATVLLMPVVAMACDVPDPVHGLSHGSRYADGTGSTVIDAGANAAVDEELGPVDDFIRQIVADADASLDGDVPRAACGIEALAVWAQAGALGALKTDTAKLTIGSRIAGLALAARKLQQVAPGHDGWPVIEAWLSDLVVRQRQFWEADAPPGASQGNLRAWAALGGAAVAELTDDAVTRGWAIWSAAYVACTADADGALPQEMTRGKHALHYQLHAVAPLVVTAALLRDHVDLLAECEGALTRAARFAMADLADGAQSERITGKVQSFFDGSRDLGGFQLAWIEAYLSLRADPAAEGLAATFRPLANSKLGGAQSGIWGL